MVDLGKVVTNKRCHDALLLPSFWGTYSQRSLKSVRGQHTPPLNQVFGPPIISIVLIFHGAQLPVKPPGAWRLFLIYLFLSYSQVSNINVHQRIGYADHSASVLGWTTRRYSHATRSAVHGRSRWHASHLRSSLTITSFSSILLTRIAFNRPACGSLHSLRLSRIRSGVYLYSKMDIVV